MHSLAYFIFDTIIEIYYGTTDLITTFHHIFVIGGSIPHLFTKFSGCEYMLMLFVAELSNPCMIIRTFLKILKKTDSSFYFWNEMIFGVTFLFNRTILTYMLILAFYENWNTLYSDKFCISCVFFL